MRKAFDVLFALVFTFLLISCGGGGGGGGTAPSTESTSSTASTYSGSFNVNGGSYSTLVLSGTSSGTATLNGTSGTLTGNYTSGRRIADGTYTITFSNGWSIVITISGNNVTITYGSVSASGTGTYYVSSNSKGPYNQVWDITYGSMTAEEESVYNSMLGTHWKLVDYEVITGVSNLYQEIIVNIDGTGYWHEHQEFMSGGEYDSDWDFSEILTRWKDGIWIFEIISPSSGFSRRYSISDSNGDGVVDTPCYVVNPYDTNCTRKFFTKIQ